MNLHLYFISGLIFAGGFGASVQARSFTFADADSAYADTVQNRAAKLMVLPIIFSSPDTRLAFGVLPQLVFRNARSGNPSSVRLDAFYTLNRQFQILLRPTLWYRNDSRLLSGKMAVKEWPTSFYGIGNDTDPDNKEKFTETMFQVSVDAAFQIKKGLFAGIGYSLRYGEIDPEDSVGRLASRANPVPGSGTTLTSTLGTVFRLDTRDNHFYPSRGSLHRLTIDTSVKGFASDFGFTRYSIDLRKYLAIHERQVLAVQAVVEGTAGTVPFRLLPSVGGVMRGYSSVRYIDRNLIALQLEYRYVPLFWRVGFVAFAGVADVFDRPADLAFDTIKYTAGLGIRFQFSRSEKINIRLDYGIGRDSSGDYIDLNEAY